MSEFRIATRDELWSRGVLFERRLSHGMAEDRGAEIVASNAPERSLVDACDALMESMRPVVARFTDARVRAVATVREIASHVIAEATMTVAMRGLSIVTTPQDALEDVAMLRALAAQAPAVDRPLLPIVWLNGSAAVLLHEAAGHAAEHDAAPVDWPSWLSVEDDPPFDVDDAGAPAERRDLLRQRPSCLRRASFRDVPLPRMTRVVARQHDAPFELPDARIEVHLAAGGAYEPLSDEVTVDVAVAYVVEGARSSRLQPFTYRASRAAVARSLAGAEGDAIRYPGVVCSREGQELVVGSHAPLILTR